MELEGITHFHSPGRSNTKLPTVNSTGSAARADPPIKHRSAKLRNFTDCWELVWALELAREWELELELEWKWVVER